MFEFELTGSKSRAKREVFRGGLIRHTCFFALRRLQIRAMFAGSGDTLCGYFVSWFFLR